ncbi:MAG TPA: hypothetical protein VGJ51_07410 [Candidatus Angelobacter sp.]
MELLDRYLQAVRFWLPRKQQDDIIAELGDDLRSQIEDRESLLGRPLNEDELVALLKQAGHPLWVAGRYQKQQALIGPVLFPLYSFVLKIVALGYLVPWFLTWIVLTVFVPSHPAINPALALIGRWGSLWTTMVIIFGSVTLAFAILERVQSAVSAVQQWDPRKLPRVARPKERVSRVESVFGLVFSVVFIAWWLSLSHYGALMFGPIAGFFSLNPALRDWYLPALVPTCIIALQQCVNILRPQWTWFRAAAMLVSDSIALFIFVSVAKIHPYLLPAESANLDAQHTQALVTLNQVISWSILCVIVGICIAAIVHAYQTVRELRRMSKGSRNGAALPASQTL